MSALTRRIRRLEDRCGDGKSEGLLLVRSGVGLALDVDQCVEILRECGFLPTGRSMDHVNLCTVPDGLDAKATERFLRQKGAEICNYGDAQNCVDTEKLDGVDGDEDPASFAKARKIVDG